METLSDADLVIVFARRRALPADQMQHLRDYLAAGKPLIGLRTASHAFDTRGNAPKGHAEWKSFDPEVLGGNYHGHYRSGPKVTVTPAAGAANHPILAGVKLPFTTDGALYKTKPLAKSTTPLLIGTIPDESPEPIAWANQSGKSRVFYTSLAYIDDFENPQFMKMMVNAVFWAMNRPVPN
jgi:type 1 glutamine amidotransferase